MGQEREEAFSLTQELEAVLQEAEEEGGRQKGSSEEQPSAQPTPETQPEDDQESKRQATDAGSPRKASGGTQGEGGEADGGASPPDEGGEPPRKTQRLEEPTAEAERDQEEDGCGLLQRVLQLGHQPLQVGQILFCAHCGVYGDSHLRQLLETCPKVPRNDGAQFRKRQLLRCRHPTTGETLGPISKPAPKRLRTAVGEEAVGP